MGARWSMPIMPILWTLHWLPICYRAQFKVVTVMYKVLHSLSPSYLQMFHHNNFAHISKGFCRCRPANGQDPQLSIHVLSILWSPPGGMAQGGQESFPSPGFLQTLRTKLFRGALLHKQQDCTVQNGSQTCLDNMIRDYTLYSWVQYIYIYIGSHYVKLVLLNVSC